MQASKVGVAILIALFLAGPVGATGVQVTIDIPDASEGAALTLNSVLYEVGTEASWVIFTAEPVIAGAVLDTTISGPSKQHDYVLENTMGVAYPSGRTVLVEWACGLIGEWIDLPKPGCDCGWVD